MKKKNDPMLAVRLLFIRLITCCIFYTTSITSVLADNFDHLVDAQGNSLINVRNMVFDDQGYLWLGGDAGVYRFDGYQLVHVNKQPTRGLYLDQQQRFWSAGTTTLMALTDGNYRAVEYPNLSNKEFKPEHEVIYQVYNTQNNRQFFATKEGLSEYFHQQDSFKHFDVKTTNSGDNIAVLQLLQITPEHIYLGTKQGLYRLPLNQINDRNNHLILPTAIIKDITVTALTFDQHNNQLLVGTNNGLYVLDHKDQLLAHIKNQSPNGLSNNNITAILVDNQAHLWVGTSHGLNLSTAKAPELNFKQFFHRENDLGSISNNMITDLKQDANNNILIATYSGIERYHHGEIKIKPHQRLQSLKQSINNVWSMAEDNQGNLWIGTFGSGLSQLTPDNNFHHYLPNNTNTHNSLASTRVPSLMASGDQLFIGTTKGLQVLDIPSKKLQHIPLIDQQQRSKSDKTIFDIAKAQDGSLWLATQTGIVNLSSDLTNVAFYDKHSTQRIQYKQWVRTVLPLDHRVLVGSDKGLHIINQNRQHVTQLEQAGSVVKIFQDSNEHIWVVGLNKVMLFDRQTEQLQSLPLTPPNPFEQTEKQEHGCNAITEDHIKQLWLVCGDNLKVIDIRQQQLLANFGKQDKIDMSKFLTGSQSFITTKQGNILLGERGGITQFQPINQQQTASDSNIVLSHVNYQYENTEHPEIQSQINQNPFNFVKTNTLSNQAGSPLHHGLKKIEFQFSSLDYARPQGSQYRYKLLGYDNDWTVTKADNRRANYTNLPHGKYTFQLEVKATGKPKVALQYPFTIERKPWFSWWAYALYFIAFIALMYALILLRTQNLRKQQNLLQQRIIDHTHELEQSKQEVEQLMLEREKLIENIYHQTRTPLQIMLGNINALQNSQLSINDYANKQTEKVNALVRLTDQILDVSKVTQTSPEALQPINLTALIKPLVIGFSEITKGKGIQFSWQVDENMAVKGSVNSLENAIDNLLSNALKYTPSGAIRFSAKIDNNQIIMQCSDTGIGIAPDQQQLIFKRYHRADNSENIEGAGIGLAMVKDVIDACNGKITVDSELNKGTTIKVILPRIKVEQEQLDNEKVPEYQLLEQQIRIPASTNKDNTKSASILIVEDNLELINYMVSLLTDNYQVHTALNGRDGVRLAKETVPDVIISDVMMSVMDGFELTRQIRQNEITSHIPVLLITAKSDEQSREKGFAIGASDFINKPFKAPDLLNRITNQLLQIQAIQKRLKQQTQQDDSLDQRINEDRLITRYLSFVANNYQNNDLKIKDACQSLHISIRQLERKVRHFLDMTPNELLNDYRLSRSKELLKQGQGVSTVYEQCGFSSHAYFSKRFKEKYGQLPSHYKK